MELCTLAFDYPDAQRLIVELQQEYVQRYGGEDDTPVDVSEFAAPQGTFVVGYLEGVAVACGGWRAHQAGPEFTAGDAELKGCTWCLRCVGGGCPGCCSPVGAAGSCCGPAAAGAGDRHPPA